MADLAASDVTHSVEKERRVQSRVYALVKFVFGDSSLTYPAGGVPITKAKLGCPNEIESMVIFDSGTSGYRWTYDRVNGKLVAIQSPAISAHTHTVAHAHDLLIKGGQAAASTAAVAYYATDILGKEAATDKTIAKADTATKGGVLTETPTTSSSGSSAAAAGTQPSTVAIAAQTLYAEVVGW